MDTGAGSAQSGFELHFEIPIGSPLRALFLGAGSAAAAVPPFIRVVLIVVIDGRTEQLVVF